MVASIYAVPASADSITVPCASSGSQTGGAAGLVDAIAQADQDARSGPSTITLAAGCTYDFTDAYQGTTPVTGPSGPVQLRDWYGPSALPAIAANITIDGNGATLSATQPTSPNATSTGTFNPTFRFFYVGADPSATATQNYLSPGAGDLTLEDLTLSGGEAQGGAGSESGGGAGLGGAIFNQGTLNLDAVTMTSNTASGGSAGDSAYYTGGGGIGTNGGGDNSGPGGGFGPGVFGGPATNASYGGIGFTGESGQSDGAGGGQDSGLGGSGGNGGYVGCNPADGGDGSGGVTAESGNGCGGAGNTGGVFGSGGEDFGGGGVGGGGGYYGGGGFGAGGGYDADGGFGGGGGGFGGAGGFGGGSHGGAQTGGAGAGMGGAIFNMQGIVTVTNSTLEGNSAVAGTTSAGAGSAQALGGALFNLNGTMTLDSSTVDANTAAQGGSGAYSLAYDSAANLPASLTSTNSIIYGDTNGDVEGNAPTDTAATANMDTGSVTETNANVIDSVTSSGSSTLSTSTGTTSADPGLGPLQSNGGPGMSTQLVSLSGSAAGAGANCQASDERGIPRPSQKCDVGATQINPPTISITTPAANATDDQGETVLANYSCSDPSDNETPTCSGTVGNGTALDTSTAGPHTFAVTSKSSDGLQTQQQVSYMVVAPPTVAVTTPAANASYTQGQTVDANYSCSDPNGPGISSCTGTVANGQPINTSTTGTQTFSVTATSRDGLTQAQSVSYTVSAPPVVPTSTPTPAQPAPTAQASVTPASAGLTYQFTAAGSSGNGSAISSYSWTLGGQNIGTGATITHTFSALGRLEIVQLTVTDADGQSTSTTIEVTPRAVKSVDRLTVTFAADRAALTTADRLALDPLRGIFARAETVQIDGYCSYHEVSFKHGLTGLSKDRAEAVLDLLKAFKNTSSAKIKIAAYAASHFVATNKTEAGRARNRRVTVVINFLRPVS